MNQRASNRPKRECHPKEPLMETDGITWAIFKTQLYNPPKRMSLQGIPTASAPPRGDD